MLPHTRAIVVAAAYALVRGRKVAGVHDHATGEDLRIAAEARGSRVQAIDGDREAVFGGTLPELHDADSGAFISLEIEGDTARGYDRGSATHYTITVTDLMVQFYDHGEDAWFAFGILPA